jgi:hypothetical protein
MPPLAFQLLKDLTTPGAFRSTADRIIFWAAVQESKFFDMTAVQEVVGDTAQKIARQYDEGDLFNGRLAFLTAAHTWLETEMDCEDTLPDEGNRVVVSRRRVATVLVGIDCTREAGVMRIMQDAYGQWTLSRPLEPTTLPLVASGRKPDREAQREWSKVVQEREPMLPLDDASLMAAHFVIYAALALINTPRVIGQRRHMPHERIERDKLKSLGLVGKFPLHAWTEIILRVALPDDRTGEPSREAHLTGEKCLHFCRTHIRVRLGLLEYVEGHYRGNPALGFKRSRYSVES